MTPQEAAEALALGLTVNMDDVDCERVPCDLCPIQDYHHALNPLNAIAMETETEATA